MVTIIVKDKANNYIGEVEVQASKIEILKKDFNVIIK